MTLTVRELHESPSMTALFARACAGALPGVAHVPFLGLGPGGEELPDLTLTLNGVPVEPERLAAYDRVCGLRLGDRLPATYPHMPAFPLHLALMTDRDFPFGAIGLVHIANHITQHRALRLGERLDLKVWAGDLRPHPRGRQFSIFTEVRSAGELVWEEVSTNLHRGGGVESAQADSRPGARGGSRQGEGLTAATELPVTATWRLPGDLGRRYGAVSGDMNPIHVHPLTARLFGFPGAIAHGMWTKARCLAALAPQLPDAFTVRVEFRKPIVLPAKVAFAEQGAGDAIAFGVRHPDKDVSHLDGAVSWGAAPRRRR